MAENLILDAFGVKIAEPVALPLLDAQYEVLVACKNKAPFLDEENGNLLDEVFRRVRAIREAVGNQPDDDELIRALTAKAVNAVDAVLAIPNLSEGQKGVLDHFKVFLLAGRFTKS